MKHENINTLILGAGPAGLATAKVLAEADVPPILIERSKVSGGLMRSIKRGEFSVDIGRKELYSRIPEVDRLWRQALGNQYRSYPHRVGVLYSGKIIETSISYNGFRYGIPWNLFLESGIDYFRYRIKSFVSKPKNYEEFHYQKFGRRFSQIKDQGYQEKFKGKKWIDMPPQNDESRRRMNLIQSVKKKLNKSSVQKNKMPEWRHPAKGSGQIAEMLEKSILNNGAQIQFDAEIAGITTSQGRINAVDVKNGSDKLTYYPEHVVSSLPIEILMQIMSKNNKEIKIEKPKDDGSARRSVVLVYLFLDEPPKFDHAWLHVTCPNLKMGRVTNYAGFNGEMVPKDQTCLCVEFFCPEDDPLFELDNDELQALALEECTRARLIDAEKCFDYLAIKLPGVDPSADWQDWLTKSRLLLLDQMKQFKNLYNVNRAGTDVATYAGIKAADAILSGCRGEFDTLTDPTKYPPTADW